MCSPCFFAHKAEWPVLPSTAPPTNTSLSVSPGEEVVEGQKVTFTCSSDGAPPPKLLLKKGEKVVRVHEDGSPLTFSIRSATLEDSTSYLCEASNKHGSQAVSSVVTVRGQFAPISVFHTLLSPEKFYWWCFFIYFPEMWTLLNFILFDLFRKMIKWLFNQIN